MSLKYRNSQGVETPVAGLNGTSGELVPSVALQQSGNETIPIQAQGVQSGVAVTFATPMPDANYTVSLSCTAKVLVLTVQSKTATGFTIGIYAPTATAASHTASWIALYPMTDTVHEADAAHIAQNTANFAPAFSETTSYAVGDYVTYGNVLYRCTTAHTAGTWVAGHFTVVTVGESKVDKVSSATDGDIASLDANGNLVDSGVVASSVIRRAYPSADVDCNDLIDRFTEYRVGEGAANRPTTDANAYIIKTFRSGAASTVYSQIAYQIGGVTTYRRRFTNNTWSSWQKLVTLDELKSVVASSTDFADFKTKVASL